MTLENTIALVTGGSRGIGRAICVRLAAMGATVGINYVANPTAAEETLRLVEVRRPGSSSASTWPTPRRCRRASRRSPLPAAPSTSW